MKNTLIFITLVIMISVGSVFSQVEVHGFVSQGFLYTSGNTFLADNSEDGSVDMREIGINFQQDVSDRIHIGIQLLSRKVGVYGNNVVGIDWAYGSYYINDLLTLSAGRVKSQLGFYTDIQDIDFLVPYAMLPPYLYDKGLRAVTASIDGFKLSGNYSLGSLGNLSYSAAFGNTDVSSTSDIVEYGNVIGTNTSNATANILYSTNIRYETPISGLTLNSSYFKAPELFLQDVAIGTFPDVVPGVGGKSYYVDVTQELTWLFYGIQYQHELFDAIVEYHTRNAENAQFVILDDGSETIVQETPSSNDRSGGYAGVTYKALDWFNVAGCYSWYVGDTEAEDISAASNIFNDIALTGVFIPSYNLIIKLEYHMVNGTGLLSALQNPDGFEDKWSYLVAKASFSF